MANQIVRFLHGDRDVPIYVAQPPNFFNSLKLDHVCLLHHALYGLK